VGSGFNLFTNWIDKTPGTTGSWVDVDCSANIPSGSTGVILRLVNTGSSDSVINVRKNGSTDNDLTHAKVLAKGHIYAIIGVDSNRIFEAYIANANCKIYLLGYTDENVVLRDNEQQLSAGAGGVWNDTNVSAYCPEGTTGVILRVSATTSDDSWKIGFRKKGSTWNKRFRFGFNYHAWVLVGVDSNRIFQHNHDSSNPSDILMYLVGYTKSPVTFLTNPVDISLTTTGAWTDIDVTNYTEASADGAIVWIVNGSNNATHYKGGVRKNGSTNDDNANMKIHGADFSDTGYHITGLCGLDADNILEGHIENTVIDFYLVGYCKPAAAGITVTWSALLNTNHVFARPFRSMKFTQNINATHIFRRPFRFMKLTQALRTTHVFLRHRIIKMSQALRTLHTWIVIYPGLILKQWFATLQTTHTFKRPFRTMKLVQTLRTIHTLSLKRWFKFTQTLNLFHVLERPFRHIGYMQTIQPAHVFRRPVRLIKFPATLQLTHLFNRPTRFMKFIEQLTLGHAYFVAVPSVKKTRLFLVIGDLAIQLSRD
jgi:hypothetical protein